MAKRKVELTDEERKAMGQSFITFTAIGQRFKGRLTKKQAQTGRFAKPDREDYFFKYRNPPEGNPGHRPEQKVGDTVEHMMKSYGDICQKLKKGNVKVGEVVEITYLSDLAIEGFDNAMPIFDVEIDDTPAGQAAKPAAAAAPKPATPPPAPKPQPAPAPAASEEPTDDIPF